LIRRGRRRQLWNLFVHQTSFATVLALGGAILLLLLGTQILNWYWLVLLFTVSLAAGAYRARKQVLSPYQVSQSIDAQLGLHDSLSTAFFFSQHPDHGSATRDFVEGQRQVAEGLARSADVRQGLPFVTPRTFYVNAALAVAVCAMFGLRYGVNRSLDLRPSLVKIAFDGFLGHPREIADASRKQGRRPFDQDGHRDPGMAVDPWESKPADLDPASDETLKTIDEPEVNNPDGGSDAGAKAKATGKDQQQPGDDPLNADKGESSPPGEEAAGDQEASPDGGQQSGKQPNTPKNSNQSSNSGENSSLSDKMRDALANLMAKLKMQTKSSDGKQGGSSAQNSQGQKQNQSQNANSKSSPGQQQSEANASSQSQGDQQAQNGSQQAAQGRSEARNSDHSTEDGKSGVGKQDGDKSAREAEQLAAMGKISEIIGKRSANVTGEVMVEVASGKQQLRTQYSQRKATHVESGGEINRDEVPLAYQQYVQQYFEEIRKLPAAKTKPAADGKSKSSGS
jgi:hypothetical protein